MTKPESFLCETLEVKQVLQVIKKGRNKVIYTKNKTSDIQFLIKKKLIIINIIISAGNLNLTFQISSDTTLTSGNIDSTIITVRPFFSYRKMSSRIGPKGYNKVQLMTMAIFRPSFLELKRF